VTFLILQVNPPKGEITMQKTTKTKKAKALKDLKIENGSIGIEIAEAKEATDSTQNTIEAEIQKYESQRGFVPGQGKAKAEAFVSMGFEFEARISRDPVYAMGELASEAIKSIKQSDDDVITKAIRYVIETQSVSLPKLIRALHVSEDESIEIIDRLVEAEVIGVTSDGSFEVKAGTNHPVFASQQVFEELLEARTLPQNSEEERFSKCDRILQILQKLDPTMTRKSQVITDLETFPVVVTKLPNQSFGTIFATAEMGGFKLAHFFYVGYEQKIDSKGQQYWGMVENPYSNIDWSSQQGRLKIIGYDADGEPFRDGRKFGVFATSNMTQLLPVIQRHLKDNWVPVLKRIEPLQAYYFTSAECDYTEGEFRFVHIPGSSHSEVFRGEKKVGLAGTKTIRARYQFRDRKTREIKTGEREMILTDWIPANVNDPLLPMQQVATDHVLKLAMNK